MSRSTDASVAFSVKDNLSESVVFQSTLPVRGATGINYHVIAPFQFQSTLPVRGATLLQQVRREIGGISIHAPRKGSDHLKSR